MTASTVQIISVAVVIGTFAALSVVEIVAPARGRSGGERRRLVNLSLLAGGMLLVAALPLGTISAAALALTYRVGLFHKLETSLAWQIAALLLARTFVIYWLHRSSHHIPMLWRIHRVHHADPALDLTTSVRHHPLELLIYVAAAGVAVFLLGVSAIAVIAADNLIFLANLMQHGDFRIPARIDRFLALIVVTPTVHQVHHSERRDDHDSNYGDVLTLWDRIFGTYRVCPKVARLGLGDAADVLADRLTAQLYSPFAPMVPIERQGSDAA